ncbi:hypothetical protein GCM10010399_90080 [Dactylosporangium fulvum]|uniref:Uncharacterized protein n=1 Tax=Dactylosporangium fulvum TaxID=53359 RepID=A0ABY5W8J5_9ACTN|nr:hypothetical protein [Dactylosporangium fulvum]UWP85685.1 hypothetical protein Dfulv_16160 [Dactylosporangium fulvum]
MVKRVSKSPPWLLVVGELDAGRLQAEWRPPQDVGQGRLVQDVLARLLVRQAVLRGGQQRREVRGDRAVVRISR